MSARVISVVEQASDGGGENNGVTTFKRVFLVQLSAPDPTGADIALNASSIPKYGDPWPNKIDGRAAPVVVSRDVSQEGERGGTMYKVTVTYSNDYSSGNKGTGGTTEQEQNADVPPWMQPARVAYDFSEYPIAMQQDHEGKPVVNSNGEPFDPPIMTTLCMPRITITKSSLFYNPTLAYQIIGTTNSSAFAIIGGPFVSSGNARLLKFSGTVNYYVNADGSKIPYYEVSIEIQVAPETGNQWDKKVLNAGYTEKLDGKIVRAKTEDGKEPTPQPVLLNADGTRVSSGGSPTWLTFKQFRSGNWSSIASL